MDRPQKNVTKYRELIEELQISEKRYRTLFEQSRDAIVITTPEGGFVDANQSALDLFEYTRDELKENDVYAIYVNPNDRKRFIKEIAKNGYIRDFEVKLKKKNGVEIDCLFTFSIRRSINNQILEYQGIIRDITSTKRMEQKLIEMSLIDELTGLYNRRGLFIMAGQHLKVAKRMKRDIVCVFMDIDSMKFINDSYGHSTGDSVLKETADFLKSTFRESDIIARYGGDEFVVLILDDMENSEIILSRIDENLKFVPSDRNREFKLSLSVGISIYKPESGKTIEELISESDAAMYGHKKKKIKN